MDRPYCSINLPPARRAGCIAPLKQVHSEEPCAARNENAPVIGHDRNCVAAAASIKSVKCNPTRQLCSGTWARNVHNIDMCNEQPE